MDYLNRTMQCAFDGMLYGLSERFSSDVRITLSYESEGSPVAEITSTVGAAPVGRPALGDCDYDEAEYERRMTAYIKANLDAPKP